MRKRSEEILRLIVKNKTQVSVHFLKKKYEVTERTIRNDLVEINEFLRTLRISDIYIDLDGKLKAGPDFDPSLVESELTKITTYFYKMSPKERHIYIMLLLLWEQKYFVMQNIANKLCVSRVTILNDFEGIKEEFEKEGIAVISDAGKGVRVRSSRQKCIQLLTKLFHQLMLDVEDEGFFQRFILEQLHIQYTFNEICSYAQEYMSENHLVFMADILYDTVLYLFVVFNFTYYNQKTECEKKSEDSDSDNLMLYIGNHLNCFVSQEMLQDFRTYIKENEINLCIKNLDEIEFYEVVIHFLTNIDQELHLTLSQDAILVDSLLLHIKNMRDWGELELEISDLNEIVFDYQKLLQTIDNNISVLEKYLSYKINENMKKSILIHICVAMIRNNKQAKKPSVILVCPGSMATGRYLEVQIESYFDFNIKGLFPVSVISKHLEKLQDVDFVISTVGLSYPGIKCLKVHAVLTMQDMKLIQKTALEYQNQKSTPFYKKGSKKKIDQLQGLLQEKELPKHLYQKLEILISEYRKEREILEKTAIGELLERDNIFIHENCGEWEACIRKSADVLLQKGYIGQRFIEKAIQNIKDYGDYIILGDGVALAHAGKDYDVYHDSLSLLVSKQGIIFTDADRKVNFLFCFSTKGEDEYIELFHEIIEIGRNEELRKCLLSMNEEELYQALCFK